MRKKEIERELREFKTEHQILRNLYFDLKDEYRRLRLEYDCDKKDNETWFKAMLEHFGLKAIWGDTPMKIKVVKK